MKRCALVSTGFVMLAMMSEILVAKGTLGSGFDRPASVRATTTLQDQYHTSFESLAVGDADGQSMVLGGFERPRGDVKIVSTHARTGQQCLHLAGGERTGIEIAVDRRLPTRGTLSFCAERWTKRDPFSFRIEAQCGGVWTEVYNGDRAIQVGRSFKSLVQIRLPDRKLDRLRFTVSAPEKTGILIDDLSWSPARPQRILAAEVVPVTLPALIGNHRSVLAKLNVRVEGTEAPLIVESVAVAMAREARDVLESVQLDYSGSVDRIDDLQVFAAPKKEGSRATMMVFSGRQALSAGDNYFWLTGKLKTNADISGFVTTRFITYQLVNRPPRKLSTRRCTQRLGVALRDGGDDGVHTFRIPGLVTTNDGTLIAVYDIRHDGRGDLPGNIDVGMSRSIDGGRQWEPMQVIMDMGNATKWRGDGIGDPCVLVDRVTGTIWVSAVWSHGNRGWHGSGPGIAPTETGQWMMVRSDDDGKTWSSPINITRQIKDPEWSFILQGPGKGITMSDGTLVFPAQFQDRPNPENRPQHRIPRSTVIFSRDHGATWEIGTGAWDNTTEAQVVENRGGELMLNCRTNGVGKRAVLTTRDFGATWNPHPTHLKALIEPGACMASLIHVGRELDGRKIPHQYSSWMLFSNPNSSQGRRRITIKASPDLGETWPEQHQLLLDEGVGSGYSCLSMIDGETVGILYEGSQAELTFQRIKLSEFVPPRSPSRPASTVGAPDLSGSDAERPNPG